MEIKLNEQVNKLKKLCPFVHETIIEKAIIQNANLQDLFKLNMEIKIKLDKEKLSKYNL